MGKRQRHCRFLFAAALAVSACLPAYAGACLGDWGHFLSYYPKTYFFNPEGRAFRVTLHCMRWPFKDWNPDRVPVRVTDPEGKVVFWEELEIKDTEATATVPASGKGSYLLEVGAKISSKGKEKTEFDGICCWLETDLDRAVVWTGDPRGHVVECRRLICQASVPRKWWFWVPPATSAFTVRAQRGDRYMSQREDWGISIYSPRGQRMRVLWGQPPRTAPAEYRQEMEQVIEVEPGASGRFWCLEMRLGDSPNYAKPNVCLEGVPPYLARSPEEWFDPESGQIPHVPIYDDTPFVQAAYEPKDETRWPHLQHWSPCPSLGDPDGIMVRGDGEFALWNPEDRLLHFAIGDYCPRAGFGKYDRQAEKDIVVPPGLDGKIWHMRVDVASASRMITSGPPDGRYLAIYLTLEIRGIPALLAPTWEQWFDPAAPCLPWERR